MNLNLCKSFLFIAPVLLLNACSTNAPHHDEVTAIAPLPEAVTSFGAVSRDGWLYVCGGHRGERHEYSVEMVSGSFFRLNLVEGKTWEKLPSTEPAQGAPLVADGNYIYRVGGMAARNHIGETNSIFSKTLASRFDLRSGTWEDITPLPEARSSHDAVIVGHKLYVGGGWQLNGTTAKTKWQDTLLVLDLTDPHAQWRSLPQPFQRRGLAIAVLDTKLYCIGGMDAHNKPVGTVDIFDTKTEKWSQGPILPEGTMEGFGCSAIQQNHRLYASPYSGVLYQLSRDGQAWENVGTLHTQRFFHRLVPMGSTQLLAIGGEDEDGKLNDVEILSPTASASKK